MTRLLGSKGALAAALLLIVLAAGCGSKKAKYYMLGSPPDSASTARAFHVQSGRVVGVGPVRLPDYLIRYEIVTRTESSEMKFAEFHRWAEPLDETMVRVLAENLAALIPGADVRAYPYIRAGEVDLRIPVEVRRFEYHPDGKVYLVALYKVTADPDDDSRPRRAEISAEAGKADYESIVDAMSRALAMLSEEIARSIPD
jgi:uncharacterized lipoprotein YmbA